MRWIYELITLTLVLSINVYAQNKKTTLKEFSEKTNKTLPEIYDPVTKLISTSVENNNLSYHFVLSASREEFNLALPKVRFQILKSICSSSREKMILEEYKANLIYRYESIKGESLGEFMVKSEYCGRKG
jgi:hypothetical protein